MKHTRLHRSIGTLVPAFALAIVLAPESVRAGSFSAADSLQKQVFCNIARVNGQFSSTESKYTANGNCVGLESPQKGDSEKTNTSEFPRVNESKELFNAAWTAQGSYNPVTKEAWEKVTMPAPTIDQKTPVGRPYGNYETRMICATDPWLTGIGVQCTGKTVKATGNLGDTEAALRALNRPVTTPNKAPLLQALNTAHDRYVSTHAFNSTTAATSKSSAVGMLFAPTVVEPKPNSTHRPQTAMSIRVAPAETAKDTAYELEIQVQANFDWRVLTNIPVSAAVAQSALGYKGWGAHADGTGAQMTAIAGVYRVRAKATAPSRSAPSDWVEFKIDGKPGVSVEDLAKGKIDARSGAKTSAAAAALATEAPRLQTHGASVPAGSTPVARPAATAGTLTRSPVETLKSKTDAVLLNPQPLPPKTATATPSPLSATRTKADAVLLNPQPLPPSSLTPAQVPGALR